MLPLRVVQVVCRIHEMVRVTLQEVLAKPARMVFWVDLLTPWLFSKKMNPPKKKLIASISLISYVPWIWLLPQKLWLYICKDTTCKTLTKLARNTPSCCTFVCETLLTAEKTSMPKKRFSPSTNKSKSYSTILTNTQRYSNTCAQMCKIMKRIYTCTNIYIYIYWL